MLDLAPDSWTSDSLCLEYPAHWFFPERGESTVPAKEVCHRCLVLRPCLEMAMALHIEHGVFGATSPQERRQLRVQHVPLDQILDAAESRPQRERRLWLEQAAYEREHDLDPYELD